MNGLKCSLQDLPQGLFLLFSFACLGLLNSDLGKNWGLRGLLEICGITWESEEFLDSPVGSAVFLPRADCSRLFHLFFTLVLPMIYMEEERQSIIWLISDSDSIFPE